MSTYTVIVADTAKADLMETFAYLNERSPPAAERWLTGAERTINALGRFCGYGPAREAAVSGRPLRQRVFRSHRIVFAVDEAAKTVSVIHVRHGARRSAGESVEEGDQADGDADPA